MSLKALLWRSGTAACLLIAAGTSLAQMPDFEAQDQDEAGLAAAARYHQRLSAQLAAGGSARELALAAALRGRFAQGEAQGDAPQTDEPSQAIAEDDDAQAWRRRAAAAPGRDLLTDLLLLGAGGQLRREAATHWATAEPDNAAPLFQEDLSGDALLAALRERKRFDLHYLETVRWFARVYAQTPPDEEEAAAMFDSPAERGSFAMNAAMGLWGDIARPRFQALVDACRGAALNATPTRAADCRHAADVLAGASDTAVGRAVGSALRVDTAQDDTARAAAAEARRGVDWQMVQWGQAVRAQPDEGAAQLARLLADASVHTEIDLIARVLKEANIPLQPPADWQPPRRPRR
ncbi:hypothetical protein [Luteimonas aquatica]|uniref:hypothetical protein n=1 Tax=Luteimonas aquatica TaxID=450364 RepID=UPI001F5AB196|nr:hypothetical protein [Luteimonas aquatica]